MVPCISSASTWQGTLYFQCQHMVWYLVFSVTEHGVYHPFPVPAHGVVPCISNASTWCGTLYFQCQHMAYTLYFQSQYMVWYHAFPESISGMSSLGKAASSSPDSEVAVRLGNCGCRCRRGISRILRISPFPCAAAAPSTSCCSGIPASLQLRLNLRLRVDGKVKGVRFCLNAAWG